LPPLPPPANAVENRTILKACIPARAALAELKQAGALLPDQGLLINLLPLLEARDSSEIENIVATIDKLFRQARGCPAFFCVVEDPADEVWIGNGAPEARRLSAAAFRRSVNRR